MSVDPLGGAGAAELAALVDAELAALAANGEALQALVAQHQGAVVQARVLASNGLTDLLEIGGLRVAASLPPTVHPGDLLLVQITGSSEDGGIQLQIVQNEGPLAAQPQAPPVIQNPLPPIIPPAASSTATTAPPAPATPATVPTAPSASTPVSVSTPTANAAPAGVASPPVALQAGMQASARIVGTQGRSDVLMVGGQRIVAALPQPQPVGASVTVRILAVEGDRVQLLVVPPDGDTASAPMVSGRVLPANVLGSLLSDTPAPRSGAPVVPAPPTSPPASANRPPPVVSGETQPRVTVQAPTGTAGVPVRGAADGAPAPTSIEARLAAARATAPPPEPASGATAANEPAAPPPRAVLPPLLGRAPIPAAPSGRYAAPLPVAAPLGVTRAAGLAAYAEPVALLRALRLPVTPSGVSAATIALESPERLPAALASLENALPRASSDPHVATLRTLLAFVGRIDPRSPTLPAQIAAYVDHVVTGGEPKLALLLAASEAADPTAVDAPFADATPPAAPANAPAAAAPAPPTAAAAPAAPAVSDAGTDPAAMRPLAAAMAVERAAALDVDLKQTMLAVAAEGPTLSAPLNTALTSALTALTAVQTNAAQALAARPDGFAFTLPLATPNGIANASIAVSREGGGSQRQPLDANNFHVAFVLETANYGTVAIDLITVDREVSVDVRAEAAPAVRAFRDALGHLTARLEALHYRVSSAGATLASTATIGVAAPPSRPVDPNATVDRSA
ncbi:MAG TPA: hypothetical protein VMD91_00540 [Candidatus Sulfotelmatobacter sp.]|nr:hypothetical protein [Candidatus Sulfotelmatobacter sp.]